MEAGRCPGPPPAPPAGPLKHEGPRAAMRPGGLWPAAASVFSSANRLSGSSSSALYDRSRRPGPTRNAMSPWGRYSVSRLTTQDHGVSGGDTALEKRGSQWPRRNATRTSNTGPRPRTWSPGTSASKDSISMNWSSTACTPPWCEEPGNTRVRADAADAAGGAPAAADVKKPRPDIEGAGGAPGRVLHRPPACPSRGVMPAGPYAAPVR